MDEDTQFLMMMAEQDEAFDKMVPAIKELRNRVTGRKVTETTLSGVYYYLDAYHTNEWDVVIKYQKHGEHVSVDDVTIKLTDSEIDNDVEATSVVNLPGMLEWAEETASFYEDTQDL